MYTNQVDNITVKWDHGTTTKVAVNKEGQDLQTFNSLYSPLVFGATNRFTGVQFHFHAGSEHTVDGKRHDLEMHTVHLADDTINDVGYAAMGIIFSVNDYTADLNPIEIRIIDNFFDPMEWETGVKDPKVAEVPYGDLMMMVDMTRRWVYKGSVTTPPCGRFVYWNVVKTIYPIKERHLEQFLKQME
jgi:carbonic anhydrase